jgi:hypothetical protein
MIDRYSKIYQNRTPSKERAQYKSDEREIENKENNASLKNKSYGYDQSLGLRDPV